MAGINNIAGMSASEVSKLLKAEIGSKISVNELQNKFGVTNQEIKDVNKYEIDDDNFNIDDLMKNNSISAKMEDYAEEKAPKQPPVLPKTPITPEPPVAPKPPVTPKPGPNVATKKIDDLTPNNKPETGTQYIPPKPEPGPNDSIQIRDDLTPNNKPETGTQYIPPKPEPGPNDSIKIGDEKIDHLTPDNKPETGTQYMPPKPINTEYKEYDTENFDRVDNHKSDTETNYATVERYDLDLNKPHGPGNPGPGECWMPPTKPINTEYNEYDIENFDRVDNHKPGTETNDYESTGLNSTNNILKNLEDKEDTNTEYDTSKFVKTNFDSDAFKKALKEKL